MGSKAPIINLSVTLSCATSPFRRGRFVADEDGEVKSTISPFYLNQLRRQRLSVSRIYLCDLISTFNFPLSTFQNKSLRFFWKSRGRELSRGTTSIIAVRQSLRKSCIGLTRFCLLTFSRTAQKGNSYKGLFSVLHHPTALCGSSLCTTCFRHSVSFFKICFVFYHFKVCMSIVFCNLFL